jgi:hypothetical protein
MNRKRWRYTCTCINNRPEFVRVWSLFRRPSICLSSALWRAPGTVRCRQLGCPRYPSSCSLSTSLRVRDWSPATRFHTEEEQTFFSVVEPVTPILRTGDRCTLFMFRSPARSVLLESSQSLYLRPDQPKSAMVCNNNPHYQIHSQVLSTATLSIMLIHTRSRSGGGESDPLLRVNYKNRKCAVLVSVSRDSRRSSHDSSVRTNAFVEAKHREIYVDGECGSISPCGCSHMVLGACLPSLQCICSESSVVLK